MKKNIITWIAQILVVLILGQTLFAKFTGAPEPVELFTQLGMEPTGRYLIGFLELVACLLLLSNGSAALGAILAWGLMSGAIIGHITEIGFQGDRGILGSMAIAAWLLSLVVLYCRKEQVPFIRAVFRLSKNELHN